MTIAGRGIAAMKLLRLQSKRSSQSAQRPPHLSAWTIPLSTRRSSTRFLPRTSIGKRGSIRAHCKSENQKKSAIAVLHERTESDSRDLGNPSALYRFMGPNPRAAYFLGRRGLLLNRVAHRFDLLETCGLRAPRPI